MCRIGPNIIVLRLVGFVSGSQSFWGTKALKEHEK
jgi:hypothetical protein